MSACQTSVSATDALRTQVPRSQRNTGRNQGRPRSRHSSYARRQAHRSQQSWPTPCAASRPPYTDPLPCVRTRAWRTPARGRPNSTCRPPRSDPSAPCTHTESACKSTMEPSAASTSCRTAIRTTRAATASGSVITAPGSRRDTSVPSGCRPDRRTPRGIRAIPHSQPAVRHHRPRPLATQWCENPQLCVQLRRAS